MEDLAVHRGEVEAEVRDRPKATELEELAEARSRTRCGPLSPS